MSGWAATGRIPAVPRRGCCASSAAPRAPSCAAGSWSSPEAVHRRAQTKISKTTPCKVERGLARLACHQNILAKSNHIFDNGNYRGLPMSQLDSEQEVAAVRAFNRFYTRRLGVLDQQLLKSPFSLSEARVLYELAHREDLSAKEIGAELGLDAGYLSRIVQNFDEAGLITREPLPSDRRQYRLALTAGDGRRSPSSSAVRRTTSRRCLARCRVTARNACSWQWPTSSDCSAISAPHHDRRRCASRAPATWDGWCRATARSTPANTASIPLSRGSSPRSRRNSSPHSMRHESVAGSPISRGRRSVRYFWCGAATTSPSCGY